MDFRMFEIAPIFSHLDIFEKSSDKIKNKKQFINLFARKFKVIDTKSCVFAEKVCSSNLTIEPEGEPVQITW